MNFIEQSLALAADLNSVAVGQEIRCKVDLAIAHNITGLAAIQQFEQIGIDHVFDSQKIVMVIDHIFPDDMVQADRMDWILKDFAFKYGIRLYDKRQSSIWKVIAENHRFEPGKILIGADLHTYTAGGYGVIAIPVGSTELVTAMTTGTIDLEVPKVSEVYMTGQLAVGVSTKNIISTVIKHFGVVGLTDKAVLFTGPGITALSIEDRTIICNMGIEIGAMIACFGGEVKATDVADTLTLDLGQIRLCYLRSHSSWWFT
jgi:homoaconitase/3-isopropylmalate dehydratase large subunit